MTILSDRQIAALCTPPTHRFDDATYCRLMEADNSTTLEYRDLQHRIVAMRERDRRFTEQSMVELTDSEKAAFRPMIEPFHPELVREVNTPYTDPVRMREWEDEVRRNGRIPSDEETREAKKRNVLYAARKILSAGLSSFGYDLTLSDDVRVFTNIHSSVINPKKFDQDCLVKPVIHVDEEGARYFLLPPNSYMLGTSREHFNLPRNITAIFLSKSTYARAGLLVNATVAESGWAGQLIVEAANGSSLPIMIFIDEGFCQSLYFRGDEDCQTSYADRGGKYQHQHGMTHAKV